MKPTTTNPPSPTKPDMETLLHRIIAAVENDRGRGRLELAVAIVLSLARLASTWCGYTHSLDKLCKLAFFSDNPIPRGR